MVGPDLEAGSARALGAAILSVLCTIALIACGLIYHAMSGGLEP